MKSVETWLDEYGESHQNPINKNIHWICVPSIYFT
ncbi:PF06127 domain protein, partial [Leptospira interrogans serovar Bataviae str. UI 08561]